ncbi:MAG: FAD:protein FMN transferase [Luteolibacter sp.]|uniref:FAD:protein FMN transferase n=1 Tax=Luteolibacter sp. TaxID=1962973 RepID=UPI0032649E39
MPPIERRARPLLGTFVEIVLRGGNAAVFEAAFDRISDVQDRMSAHTAESDLAKIASEAHRGWVAVDASTAEVIRLSLNWAEASDGAFDPVRAGVELVHAKRRPWFASELPDRTATWRDLEIDGLLAKASRPLALDLGGVAKGYAVDLAAEVIATHGCSGVVNAGGDLRFIGDEKRTAFVKKPDTEGGLFELREIPFPALATTGSYAFSDDGGNLDLIDPGSDGPVPVGVSITVFGGSCILADALTKAVLNLPENRAADLLKQFDCCALILESDGRFRELP